MGWDTEYRLCFLHSLKLQGAQVSGWLGYLCSGGGVPAIPDIGMGLGVLPVSLDVLEHLRGRAATGV